MTTSPTAHLADNPRPVATLVPRLRRFTSTIFAEMTALANSAGALNLGQGFPDEDGPVAMLDVARDAIARGVNQYPPGPGTPELRAAISAARFRDYQQEFDPASEVLVTVGATEAIAATILALADVGDEVVMLEPYYDSYQAVVAMAGAKAVAVPLTRDDAGRFALDGDRLAAAITDRTKLLLINSPHNPTGTVLTQSELTFIAELAIARGLTVVTDEVYEYLTFDSAAHIPIGTLPGMAERTITISSAGKSFNVTGWKIGWVCGPAALIAAVRAAKQFLTFVGGAPFQPAVAYALEHESAWVKGLRNSLQTKRNALCIGLQAAGLDVSVPGGTYFVQADIRSIGEHDGLEFCRALPARVGVVAIPTQVFYDDPAHGAHLVRFAFCKKDSVIQEAAQRLAQL
ncbi:MAG: pyridoxal phosphate-dependent aminotransferase [Nakamurella sp.]